MKLAKTSCTYGISAAMYMPNSLFKPESNQNGEYERDEPREEGLVHHSHSQSSGQQFG